MMKRDREVKPFAWPATEPEIPARPAASAPDESVLQDESRVTSPSVAPSVPQEDALPEGIHADSTHAFLWDYAAAASAVLRSMMQENDPGTDDPALQGMTAPQLAAAFMAGVGTNVGARIMRHLPVEAEARWVGRALVEEPEVSHRIAMAALQPVRQRIEAGDYLEEGGVDYTSRLLESAFHHGRVSRLLRTSDEESVGFRHSRAQTPSRSPHSYRTNIRRRSLSVWDS